MKKSIITVTCALVFATGAFAATSAPTTPANASNSHPCSNLAAKDARIDAKFGENSKQDAQNDANLAKHNCPPESPSA